jgi:hypothetical protein
MESQTSAANLYHSAKISTERGFFAMAEAEAPVRDGFTSLVVIVVFETDVLKLGWALVVCVVLSFPLLLLNLGLIHGPEEPPRSRAGLMVEKRAYIFHTS